MDVVVAILLDLQQEGDLRLTLGGEGVQERTVLLPNEEGRRVKSRVVTGYCLKRSVLALLG